MHITAASWGHSSCKEESTDAGRQLQMAVMQLVPEAWSSNPNPCQLNSWAMLNTEAHSKLTRGSTGRGLWLCCILLFIHISHDSVRDCQDAAHGDYRQQHVHHLTELCGQNNAFLLAAFPTLHRMHASAQTPLVKDAIRRLSVRQAARHMASWSFASVLQIQEVKTSFVQYMVE